MPLKHNPGKERRRSALRKLLLPVTLGLPIVWKAPIIAGVILPAHAQTSSVTAGFAMNPEGSTDTRQCSDGINGGFTGLYEFYFVNPSDFVILDAITFADPDTILLVPTAAEFPILCKHSQTLGIRQGEVADCTVAVPGVLDHGSSPIFHFRGFPPGNSLEWSPTGPVYNA